MKKIIASAALAGFIAVPSAPIAAQTVPQSAPDPLPPPPPLPTPRDVAYPGTIRLEVDATDVMRGIFHVRETIPVAGPGQIVLLYPQWLPGNHAPRGPIEDVVGYTFTAGGQALGWRRDPGNPWALHVDVPAGARELVATFDYVSPTTGSQGRVVMTPDMLNLQWNLVALYPAGWYTRRIPVEASAKLPDGWRFGTALAPVRTAAGNVTTFETVPFETLVDSPMFAGRWFRQETLAPGVRLNIVADRAEELAATPEQIEKHRAIVRQALRLFGSQHYDRYEFLLAITDKLGGIGLEHHRSSENGTGTGYFTRWNELPGRRNLLPHEFTHSWNGKYRRGADLYTADYSQPMRNSLLWVYEGQTQYWGYVLQARSGMVSVEDTLAAYATIAAQLDTRPGRAWRPLADTTFDPIINARRPQPWLSEQRSEDYYNEGLLVWLDADMQIRALTGGRKSLDDFARAFFGPRDRDWGVSTYMFDDVVATLNMVAPYDWAAFLHERVDAPTPRAPLGWLERGGYRLVYTAEPTGYWQSQERANRNADFSYSLGLVVDKDETLSQVIWDGPAFTAGLTVGTTILAVGGRDYSDDVLRAAIADAARSRRPIELMVRRGDRFSMVSIPYYGGLRYPRLERIGSGPAALDRLLAPL